MTINDIARMAGVSKGTVSRVINNNPRGVSEETRQHILDIIERVGYVPNRMAGSITLARTKMLGLIIPDIQNMFFPQMVRGAEDCAMEHGYTLFLCNSDSNIQKEQQYLQAFIEKRVDGILINSCGERMEERLRRSIQKSNIPVVLLDRRSKDFPGAPGIFVDNEEGAYTGTCHLIDSGCTAICFLGGPEGVNTTAERFRGYRQALKESGISFRPEYVLYGSYSTLSGYERMKNILESELKIDGVFAGADIIAVGALRALRERQVSVPEEISVLGFDNIAISADLSPSLTTMAQPIYEIGYRAVSKLLAQIHRDPGCDRSEWMHTTLVLRESTQKGRGLK